MDLSAWEDDDSGNWLVNYRGGPRLRRLTLSNVDLPWESCTGFSHLKTLTLHLYTTSISITPFLIALRTCVHLEDLALTDLQFFDDIPPTPGPILLPSLKSLVMKEVSSDFGLVLLMSLIPPTSRTSKCRPAGD